MQPRLITQSALLCAAALFGGAGCATTLSPPFDTMKDSQMTMYRLQNFEPPPATQAPVAGASPFQLPPQIQQWITAGASLLPPGLLPPGLLPGTGAPVAPAAQDAPLFHGFRILEWQPINDASIKEDIATLLGHAANFQPPTSTCLYAEFGLALAQQASQTPADVLVSLSCEQVQAFNFNWPYPQAGITPSAAQKVGAIAQRVFQGH